MSTEVATADKPSATVTPIAEASATKLPARANPKTSVVARMGERFGVDPTKLLDTLKGTAFKQTQRDSAPPSNEEMMALLVVADQYGLNPFTKEIYAFFDRQRSGIVPVVSVDGWTRILNSHDAFDGIEFRWAPEMIEYTEDNASACPAWCEAVIYRKDRSRPIVVREHLDECYIPPRGEKRFAGPWQSHTKRMLRHKALIQGARVAFGFAGIYDEDEALHFKQDGEGTWRPDPTTPRPTLIQANDVTAGTEETELWAVFDETGVQIDAVPTLDVFDKRLHSYAESLTTNGARLAFLEANDEGIARMRETDPDEANDIEALLRTVPAPKQTKTEPKPDTSAPTPQAQPAAAASPPPKAAAAAKAGPEKPAEPEKPKILDPSAVHPDYRGAYERLLERIKVQTTKKGLRTAWAFETDELKKLPKEVQDSLEAARDAKMAALPAK